jgi:hypothetical protein
MSAARFASRSPALLCSLGRSRASDWRPFYSGWASAWNNASSNQLPVDVSTTQDFDVHFRERSLFFWNFPFLIFLSGCGAKPECDSFETRNAVLQIVSNDHNNALGTYAAKNSTVVKGKSGNATTEGERSANLESTKPLYLLGEKIVTTSTSADKRTLECSGSMSVTVGDTKASKEVNFTVQQSSDGRIAVSVAPFQF